MLIPGTYSEALRDERDANVSVYRRPCNLRPGENQQELWYGVNSRSCCTECGWNL
jgi:hypothetical protein